MADLDPHHRIDQAAQFLASTPPQARPRPLLPALKQMFDLSAIEVVAAIRQSHDMHGGADGRLR